MAASLTGSSEHVAKSCSPGRKILRFCIANWFMITTIIGVAIGFGIGFVLQRAGLNQQYKLWLGLPGQVYIRVLQLTILPMIAANIITVLANLNPKENGKISGIALAYILLSNLLCCLIGLVLSYVIKPGAPKGAGNSTTSMDNDIVKISYIFRNLFLNIFPENIVQMTVSQLTTDFDNPQSNAKGEVYYSSISVSGTNMIGFLFCCVTFGLATNAAKEKGTYFKNFFASLGDVVMLLMEKFLLTTPVCVMFMVMSSILDVDDLQQKFKSLGLFVALNFAAMFAHLILLLLPMVCLCRNPFKILRLCLPPYFIGFATTSAIISLPKCYDACDAYGVPKAISRFVLPLAGTMKSDASALFIVSAVFYVVQASNVALDIGKIIIVVILATAYVCALPNIPSASMVVAMTILTSIGVDSTHISILYAVEWINDRLRSGNVVLSHMFCTTFVYHACEKDFKNEKEDEEEEAEAIERGFLNDVRTDITRF